MFKKLTVKSHRGSYDVEIGYQVRASALNPETDFLIIDKTVYEIFSLLFFRHPEDKIYLLEAKEENKTIDKCLEIVDELVAKGFKKDNRLFAIGGGITQDVSGFVASTLYRGVEWHFMPTTLLAQADSCIGSKTSINYGNIKNLLGTFYPPTKIYSCAEFLATLSEDHIKSGIGEMLHYFLLDDMKAAIELMYFYDDIMHGSYYFLIEFSTLSLEIKKKMVEKDEFDTNQRRVFNYGHTFGHAIESITNYEVSHGQAVTLGMDIANFVSYKLGFIHESLYQALHGIIEKNIPDVTLEEDEIDEYMNLLSKDKKNVGNSVTCILLKGAQTPDVVKIKNDDKFKKIIQEYFIKDEESEETDEHSEEQ